MISGHIQGRLLEMLVRMLRPRRVLEIGTFTGYSALSMAAGLEEGAELHTVEVDDELEEFIRSYFDRSPPAAKSACTSARRSTSPRNWAANSTSCSLTATNADRMLMGDDGSKALVHSGSVLIADNILWSGEGRAARGHNDRHTQALLEFNRMVVEDARVENVIVPLRDGNLIRVK